MIVETECAIKPFLTRPPADHCGANEHADDRNAEQLHDVTFFIVSDFMRKHGFQFRLGKLGDKCVEKDNLAETSEPGEEGVGMTRPLAAVHHFDPAGWKMGAPCQRKEAFAQCGS